MFVKVKVKNTVLILMLTAGLFLGLGTSEVKAVWGTFDSSFGNAGTFYDTGTNSYPNSVMIQPDGKILVTGYSLASNGKKRFMLRRWTANGEIDTTFGNGGAAVINTFVNPTKDYVGWRMTMLAGGKIAVVGQVDDRVGVWIVNPDGYGNPDFGHSGQKIMLEYNFSSARIAAFGSKIVLGVLDDEMERVFIHRLNSDGSDDTTFGSNGRSPTGFPHKGNHSLSYEMIVESDTKKITIGGYSRPNTDGALVKRFERLTSNGSTDFTFITVPTSNPTSCRFTGLARTSGGEYIYTDMTSIGVDFNVKLYKLNPNGTTNISQPLPNALQLIGIQSNGNAIVGNGFGDRIDRYDAAFNFLDTYDPSYNVYYMGAVQPDDKLVLAARVNNRLTLIRWLAN